MSTALVHVLCVYMSKEALRSSDCGQSHIPCYATKIKEGKAKWRERRVSRGSTSSSLSTSNQPTTETETPEKSKVGSGETPQHTPCADSDVEVVELSPEIPHSTAMDDLRPLDSCREDSNRSELLKEATPEGEKQSIDVGDRVEDCCLDGLVFSASNHMPSMFSVVTWLRTVVPGSRPGARDAHVLLGDLKSQLRARLERHAQEMAQRWLHSCSAVGCFFELFDGIFTVSLPGVETMSILCQWMMTLIRSELNAPDSLRVSIN